MAAQSKRTLLLLSMALCSCLAQEEELSIRTLASDDASPTSSGSGSGALFPRDLKLASALLSDWEAEHWASLDADKDKVALSWTVSKEHITFQLEVATTGWVALALTFRGSLSGSDVVVGWVNDADGAATLIDAHGEVDPKDGALRMVKDGVQDYKLVVGYQYQDSTVVRFTRKINTCDAEDLAVTNDTFRVMWFYSEKDPKSEAELSELKADRTGQRSMHLLGDTNRMHRHVSDTLKWVVSSNSVLLPPKPSLYWCTLVKLPVLPGKHHMVGYRPMLNPASARYVHHIMLYECHDDSDKARFDVHVNSGYECSSPNMPLDLRKCKGIVAAWGLGGEPVHFPPEVGHPVGKQHGGADYYLVEVHYDNPAQHSNVVDSSGLEVLLTSNVRRYDSGLLTVGHEVSSFQLIPPDNQRFTTVGHCPDVCTQVLPRSGIRVFSALAHTHKLGRSIRLRHLRSGQELPTPFQDRFYDPNYQTMRNVDMSIQPHDHLQLECTYNSSGRLAMTRGGFSADNEMCLMFLHYYPASKLAHCASRLTLKHVLLALGVTAWPITPSNKHLGLRLKDPQAWQNVTFADYLKVAPVEAAAAIRLQEASLHHSHMAECFDYGARMVYADGLEFSTPKINLPLYELGGNGCYDGGPAYDTPTMSTHDDRNKEPLHSSSSADSALTAHTFSLLLAALLSLMHIL